MLFPARWYFSPPGAQVFRQPHGAESSMYLDNGDVNYEWGEVTPHRVDRSSTYHMHYDRGANPCYTGQAQVGQDQWFIDGQLPADILTGEPPPFCPACNPCVPYQAQGGLVIGGTAAAPPACPGCPQVRPTYNVTFTGGTGIYAASNGTHPLSQPPPPFYQCQWIREGNGFVTCAFILTSNPTPPFNSRLVLTALPVDGQAVYLPPPTGFVCLGTTTWVLDTADPGGTPPSCVTVAV